MIALTIVELGKRNLNVWYSLNLNVGLSVKRRSEREKQLRINICKCAHFSKHIAPLHTVRESEVGLTHNIKELLMQDVSLL